MKLRALKARRARRRRARARQYQLWESTGKAGHLKAFKRHRAAVEHLNRLISRERKRRQRDQIITREEWGAVEPRGTFARQTSLVAGVQHHTAMPTLPASATIEQESARMIQIQAGHLALGWSDIGYALVAFPSGRIYEGRPEWAVGAHTLGHNTGYAGWSLDGNYETDQPTEAAIKACRRCREELGVADRPLFGHYQLNPTACPGKNLKPYLGGNKI
jgi:hypothetical protein